MRANSDPGQNRQIAEMLDSFGDGFIAFDFDWRITHCNRGGAGHYGVPRDQMLGHIAWELPGLGEDSELRAFVERAAAARDAIDAEAPSEIHPGRWFYLRAFPLEGGIGLISRDITEAKAEADSIRADRARLVESEARFRAMADSAPSPVFVTDARGGLEFANRAFREAAGRPLEQLVGGGWFEMVHPDDREQLAEARTMRRELSLPGGYEARFLLAGGEWRWLRISARARFDETGEFQGYVGLAVDVTDERRAEERQRLLMNELNHRVKNTLATIQSLARQTLRDDVPIADARERLTERLLALSTAHNVLTSENWESADLGEIAREAVRPWDDPPGARIRLSGPRARLAPNVALALSMALHELATNAQKYGALSAPGGCVAVAWTLEAAGDAVAFEWREQGGPPVSPPASRGFGSRLLNSLTAEFGAPADIEYAPGGVRCRLRVPAA